MVITLAPTIPVEAARIAPTTTTEIAMPPLSFPKTSAMVSSSSPASPDFSRATPMKTKSGTARSVKLVIVPQILSGKMSKKFACRTPNDTPRSPKKSPVNVRLKATGKPRNRNAIIPTNISAPSVWSRGSTLDDILGPDLGLFPASGHEVVLDGLRDPLDHEQQESDDDHRLEKEAERNPPGVG